MAMFGSRPEEPTEWAGLPSEPLDNDDVTNLLPATPTGSEGDVLGLSSPTSFTISLTSIPVEPPAVPEH